ncbi:hypothetical protein MPLDJ20_120147 [Mesorhizobium plurifarium]|uniref:Uncharacterized protein n=1 Tax=Mesorhizobium plurifarium TaxID=69974 RepID=A0A090E8R1_MESPL|nr:hypothetical protein MPLDJ20_120147 [Mesorhizobium plurifarium]
MSAVFVVGALDKGFACGCQARHSSIIAIRRRFFDSAIEPGEIRIAGRTRSLHLALRMRP